MISFISSLDLDVIHDCSHSDSYSNAEFYGLFDHKGSKVIWAVRWRPHPMRSATQNRTTESLGAAMRCVPMVRNAYQLRDTKYLQISPTPVFVTKSVAHWKHTRSADCDRLGRDPECEFEIRLVFRTPLTGSHWMCSVSFSSIKLHTSAS